MEKLAGVTLNRGAVFLGAQVHAEIREFGDATQLDGALEKRLEVGRGKLDGRFLRETQHVLHQIVDTKEEVSNFTRQRTNFGNGGSAPSWVGALNDGRIRVPVEGLTSLTPELSRILKHELTHSFVQQKTHGRAPVWL